VLWTQRRYRLGLITTLAFFCGNASLYFVLALYLQHGLRLAPLAAGALFSVLALGFFASSMLAPRTGRSLGANALVVGGLVLAAGHALTGWMVVGAAVEATQVGWLLPGFVLEGWGLGMVMAPMSAAVLAGVPAEHAGVASGVMATTQQLGNALGVALIGILYFGALAPAAAAPTLPQVAHAFAASLVFLFLLALAVAGLARRFGRMPLPT